MAQVAGSVFRDDACRCREVAASGNQVGGRGGWLSRARWSGTGCSAVRWLPSLLRVGLGIGPPKVPGTPKPTASVRTSRTLGAPSGAFFWNAGLGIL